VADNHHCATPKLALSASECQPLFEQFSAQCWTATACLAPLGYSKADES
jgi:hypothetical protein